MAFHAGVAGWRRSDVSNNNNDDDDKKMSHTLVYHAYAQNSAYHCLKDATQESKKRKRDLSVMPGLVCLFCIGFLVPSYSPKI